MLLQITNGPDPETKVPKSNRLDCLRQTPYTGVDASTRPRGHSDYSLVKEQWKIRRLSKTITPAFNRRRRDPSHFRSVTGRRIIASRLGLSTLLQMIF